MTAREMDHLFSEMRDLRADVKGLSFRFFVVTVSSVGLTIVVGGAQLLDKLLPYILG
jgi:hypothetical protein